MKIKTYRSTQRENGFTLIQALLTFAILMILISAIFSFSIFTLKVSEKNERRLNSLEVAEAGINYYLWHLSHDSKDYQDGTGGPVTPPYGPYVHEYYDKDGQKIGNFTITINPPELGSNLVTVESKGKMDGGTEERTVVANLGLPSFARYAVVANDTMRFGADTETFGPVHSNGGVRFDGIAHDLVTSALTQYDDPDHLGSQEDGVHTHQPDPDQVFLAGRSFPVPTISFSGLTADLYDLQILSNTPQGINIDYSGSYGYHIVLRTNDTFDLYRVTDISGNCSGQSTGRINSQSFVASYSFPANGIVFVEDNLWLDGQINSAQVTFVSARLPDISDTNTTITINNDLEYTNYDGTDKLGLIAQKNILVGIYSEGAFSGTEEEQELRIDGALLAQKGKVGRNNFYRFCNSTYYQRNKIRVYGSIATNLRYGFQWISCWGDPPGACVWTRNDDRDNGYNIRTLLYDENLTLSPPPSFPTTGVFTILDWQEK
ncbi:MAG: hypothetical protein A2Y57_03375 [Candidatus Woykebacteria bacterium RBG_13_40_7b]|uniref:Type 4 fimbrial biogenesis protein PilX N-terminal domain-containing protein n=1 Tax=Candidatus Woykebacteria bacterium RBG_13_40_7b TaxID=1802594 RepID=A0A1G1WAL6_9BACT|nr:MAG: hypothetical protein A2Y57_03375 [Candidatus Woykebacteria bacterium RBG_13_40_7b]